jgi:imidazolonepropionase-like amidohydrolase
VKVVGHVSSEVGVPHALAAGQHIEHLDNYLEHVMADSAPMTGSVSDRFIYQPKAWESIDHIDDAKIARVAGLTARSGTWTTPTLTVFRNAFGDRVGESVLRTWPDWHMYSSEQRGMWLGSQERYWSTAASEARRKRWVSTRNRLVKAIADSGGRIMTGSDTPEFIHSYGWTLHRELESLVAAGLTPLQALAASTITPARFFGAEKEFGTIERGKRADFVLLAADPLADIRNTTKIDGVSSGGRWFDAAALDGMKRAAMTRLSGSAPQ